MKTVKITEALQKVSDTIESVENVIQLPATRKMIDLFYIIYDDIYYHKYLIEQYELKKAKWSFGANT